MRVGAQVSLQASLEDGLRAIERAEQLGLASVWVSGRFDSLTVLALAAPRTSRIELGTGIVPTYPRHPVAMAQQSLTVQVASKGRHTLGVGSSHRRSMQEMFGFDYSRPARHMREYLQVLRPLLAGEKLDADGAYFSIHGYQLAMPGAERPPSILVAALGKRMLETAGAYADGTILYLGGLRYLAEVAGPTIRAAAAAAGRPEPRIVAGLPVCVTDHADERREQAARDFNRFGDQPVYRNILDLDRSATAADVCLVGTEAEVEKHLQAYASAGATDFFAGPFGTPDEAERTLALLAGYR